MFMGVLTKIPKIAPIKVHIFVYFIYTCHALEKLFQFIEELFRTDY